MTCKYLKVNEYGLQPVLAEEITKEIKGDELADIGVGLRVGRGCINGLVDEYDKLFTIQDTINIKVDNESFGHLVINGTELSITPKFSFRTEQFIQVSFVTRGEHPLINYFLNGKISTRSNGLGEKFYNFLVIHESDLENAKDIILNKLRKKIENAINQYGIEEEKYLEEIRGRYTAYLAYDIA